MVKIHYSDFAFTMFFMDEPLRETSFLQDKLNQPEISGDLMSGRSAKSQIFEREI